MSFFKPKSKSTVRRRRVSEASPESGAGQNLYRRNRTLTGSRSGQFGSAIENQADIQSPRAAAHQLVMRRRQIGRVFLLIVSGLIAVAVLLWQLIAGFSLYAADGVRLDSNQNYSKTVQEYLQRQPQQRFRWTLNEAALTDYVSRIHPEIKSITLSSPDGIASSRLELEMRRPVASWSIQGSDRYVDSSGVAFAVNYYPTPDIQIVDETGIDPGSGAAVASGRFLGFVGRVMTAAEEWGYNVERVSIPAGTTRQIDVSFKQFNYPVKFSIDRGVAVQVEDMDRSVRHLKSADRNVKHLDVRVGQRAFYSQP